MIWQKGLKRTYTVTLSTVFTLKVEIQFQESNIIHLSKLALSILCYWLCSFVGAQLPNLIWCYSCISAVNIKYLDIILGLHTFKLYKYYSMAFYVKVKESLTVFKKNVEYYLVLKNSGLALNICHFFIEACLFPNTGVSSQRSEIISVFCISHSRQLGVLHITIAQQNLLVICYCTDILFLRAKALRTSVFHMKHEVDALILGLYIPCQSDILNSLQKSRLCPH